MASGVAKNVVVKTGLTVTKEVVAGGLGGVGSFAVQETLEGKLVTPSKLYKGIKDSLNGEGEKSSEPSIGEVVKDGATGLSKKVILKVKGPMGVMQLNITKEQKFRKIDFKEFMATSGY